MWSEFLCKKWIAKRVGKGGEKSFLSLFDLLQFRHISNEIAQRFQVEHQSPQLLVLDNEKVIGHTSHSGVSVGFIEKLIS